MGRRVFWQLWGPTFLVKPRFLVLCRGYYLWCIGYWGQYLLLCCVVSLGASLCSRHPTVGHVCPGSPGDGGTSAIVYLQAITDYYQAWHSLASELAGTPPMSLLAFIGAASSVRAISSAPVLLEYSSHQCWFWERDYRLAAALASRANYSKEAESPQVQS